MLRPLWIALTLLLAGCAVSHDVKIIKQPCLYPHVNYDFTLCRNFRFSVDGDEYLIPRGFTTDLASIPKVLWSIYSPMKTETIAGAVIHDYFYFCPGTMNRQEADAIFYDALIAKGVSKKTAYRYWAAVRIFGSSHFNQGASCIHAYARTENTIGHLRVAFETASSDISRSPG
jgi:hypothetical protein